MIRFDNVTKKYPDGTVAVDGLDLTAPTGELTVFVGPSGCGKTTSLRMINRMIEPTSGTIFVDGEDTKSMQTHVLRRKIGYVIQHAGLFPHRTIIDNVTTVPVLLGEDKKKARDRGMELLERVGLDPNFAKRYPAQLSGGQQQRVGVARALAADPPVMLMDEPFSAVDPIVREQLQAEFLRLQSELGKTIVFVTHDIDEAIKLGDQIAVLRVGGKLAQMSSPAELLTHPTDRFVSDFVGRDRGYRALGFENASNLPTRDVPTVVMGAAAPTNSPLGDWVLATNTAHEPQGWVNVKEAAGRTVDDAMLHRGGTLATAGGPLRTALDACLSSPSGLGVVVDGAGALIGATTLNEVVDIIQRTNTKGVRAGAQDGHAQSGISQAEDSAGPPTSGHGASKVL